MFARHIPYAVGAFMLTPLVLWLGLWAFAIPGPKQGLGGPLSVALGFVSLPLVAWFYVCTLGMLSNSIQRRDAFARPTDYRIDILIKALPWAALTIGAAASAYLWIGDIAGSLTMMPFGMSIVVAGAIVAGERARSGDRQSLAAAPVTGLGWLRILGGWLLSGLFRVPILGQLLREARDGGSRGLAYLAGNLVLASIVAVTLFGYPALISIALLACAGVFAMMLAIAAG